MSYLEAVGLHGCGLYTLFVSSMINMLKHKVLLGSNIPTMTFATGEPLKRLCEAKRGVSLHYVVGAVEP
jgi:hypothetical protein